MTLTVSERTDGEFTIDKESNRTYTRKFIVEASDRTRFGPQAALVALIAQKGVEIGASYINYWGEVDAYAYCIGISAHPLSDEWSDSWELVASYGPENPSTLAADPTQRTPIAVYSTVSLERPVDIDRNQQALVNGAQDPFDPSLTYDDFQLNLVVSQNLPATVRPPQLLLLKNSVNADTWFGYDANTVLLRDVRPTIDYSSVIGFFLRVEWEFGITADPWGWTKQVLNAGYRQITNVNGSTVKVPIFVGGRPTDSPVPLTQDGAAIDTTQSDWQQQVNFVQCDIYQQLSFQSLGFTNILGI